MFSSAHLNQPAFNFYEMLVVDPLHELELGVWKTLFQHLLCLLQAFGKRDLLAELDQQFVLLSLSRNQRQGSNESHIFRYRDVPSFGRDTIRKFSDNAHEMKRIAGRDYEDLLVVSTRTFRPRNR